MYAAVVVIGYVVLNHLHKLLTACKNLFKVKTLVTIAVVAVFVVLALRGSISPDNVMIIISMVVSFYFGTQHEKGGTAVVSGAGETGETVSVTPEQEPVRVPVDTATYHETHPDSE